MCWVINLVLLVISCHLGQAFPRVQGNVDSCISSIDWCQLWMKMDYLNENGASEECLDLDKRSLCNPTQMNIQVVSDEKGIIFQILDEIVRIFQKKDVPFLNRRDFVEFNYFVQNELKICLPTRPPNHQIKTILEECFQKMEVFLNQENRRCAWEVIQQDCMVILQQIEFYSATFAFR